MAISPKLELRQGQSLVMTQQLQQSIKLLQLSTLELQDFIAEEMEKNPLLVAEEQGGEAVPEEQAAERDEGSDQESDTLEYTKKEDFGDVNEGYSSEGEEGWAADGEVNYSLGSRDFSAPRKSNDFSDDEYNFEQTLVERKSLRDHMLDQLHMVVNDPVQRIIGRHLIDMVDDAGYIKDDLSQLAQLLECEAELIEETLLLLQTFDPPGVCARNLGECLALQLRERNRLDPAMETLLENLDLLGRGDVEGLKKRCAVDSEDILQMIGEVKALNPKPGNNFTHEITQPVEPDIFLRRLADGNWKVELNNDVLPRVLINQHYFVELSGKIKGKEEKKYLTEQFATANWLVKALDQRARTILKVATEIVKQQDAFFRRGIRYLKPLTLKDIAVAVEMHESTVSRVTTQKYMATSRGVYELKYFFTSSVQSSSGGDDISSRAVQHIIKELVEQEAADNILSDDTLADMLKAKGVDVARRTVAKYREAIGISSSVARRREKSISGN